MRNLLILLLLIFTCKFVSACEIYLPESYQKSLPLQDQITLHNCPPGIRQQLQNILNSAHQDLPLAYLKTQLSSEVKISSQHENLKIILSQTQKTKMIIVTKALNAFEALRQENVKVTESDYQGPLKPFTSQEDLRFYRVNKPLAEGSPLFESDVDKIPLVKAGERVEAHILVKDLKLSTTLQSQQSGGIHQQIELWNPKNQKKYTGEVIDLKKVRIVL